MYEKKINEETFVTVLLSVACRATLRTSLRKKKKKKNCSRKRLFGMTTGN